MLRYPHIVSIRVSGERHIYRPLCGKHYGTGSGFFSAQDPGGGGPPTKRALQCSALLGGDRARPYCQASPVDVFSAPATALMVSRMVFGREEIRMNWPIPTSGNARAMRKRPCGDSTCLSTTKIS